MPGYPIAPDSRSDRLSNRYRCRYTSNANIAGHMRNRNRCCVQEVKEKKQKGVSDSLCNSRSDYEKSSLFKCSQYGREVRVNAVKFEIAVHVRMQPRVHGGIVRSYVAVLSE